MTFSIIIPVYNVAPYLRECLDSVLAQTCTDWEAICVDDGSTDGSGAILDEYATRDGRFKVIHQSNAGVSVARNAGMCAATGARFCFIDGDDYIDSDWLSSFAEVGDDDVDIIFGGVEQSGSRRVGYDTSEGKQLLTGKLLASRRLLHNAFSFARCFRSELIRQNGITFPVGIKFSEDIIFNFSVLLHSRTAAFARGLHYHYRVVAGSASRRLFESSMYENVALRVQSLLQQIDARFSLPVVYKAELQASYVVGHRRLALRSIVQPGGNVGERMDLLSMVFDDQFFVYRYRNCGIARRVWASLMHKAPNKIRPLLVRLSAKYI